MRTIHKFELAFANSQVVAIPGLLKVLTVQMQYDRPCLWAEVDDEVAEVSHEVVCIYGTGHVLHPTPQRYLSTLVTEGGRFVWHVYLVLTPDTHRQDT